MFLPSRPGKRVKFFRSLEAVKEALPLFLGFPRVEIEPSSYFRDTWVIKNSTYQRYYLRYQIRQVGKRFWIESLKRDHYKMSPNDWYLAQALFNEKEKKSREFKAKLDNVCRKHHENQARKEQEAKEQEAKEPGEN